MNKNTKILIGVVAALAVVAAVLVVFLLGLFGGGETSVTGAIVYRERMALPDDAVVSVAIVDTTSGQPLSNRIIQNPGQPPIAFQVPYDESQVNESLMYVVDATIDDGNGNPLFVTRQNFPVITQGNPVSNVEVLVETAGNAPPAASVFITIEMPLPGAILDVSQPVRVSGQGGALPEGNVVVQALDRDGNVLAERATTVDAPDAGTGGQGPWSVELNIDTEPGMAGRIRAFSPSPADNSVVAEAVVEVSLGQTEAVPVFIEITEPSQNDVLNINRIVAVEGVGSGLPENNVVVQAIAQNGTVLAERATTVNTPEVGGRGPWAVDLNIAVETGTPGQIYAFSRSPADNSLLAEARINVLFGEPAEVAPPTAVLEGPLEAFVGDEVTFQGGNSIPGSSPIVVYSWNFGNTRSANDTPDVSVTTVYDEPGQYEVSLTVRDQNDLSDTATLRITINEREPDAQPPTSVINIPAEGVTDEPVTLDGTNSIPGNGGNIVRYDWDFGDGDVANAPVIEHTYGAAGTYIVTLTVTDEAGRRNTSTANLRIMVPQAPPTPEPTDEPGEGSLEGRTWTLAGTPEGIAITLLLEGGAISGSAGCNNYTGSYSVTNDQIIISGLSSGRQVCEDEVMAAEEAFLQALPTATTYQVNGDSMTLNTAGGSLNFTSMVSAF